MSKIIQTYSLCTCFAGPITLPNASKHNNARIKIEKVVFSCCHFIGHIQLIAHLLIESILCMECTIDGSCSHHQKRIIIKKKEAQKSTKEYTNGNKMCHLIWRAFEINRWNGLPTNKKRRHDKMNCTKWKSKCGTGESN